MQHPVSPQAPGVALHLIQRARGACFFGERDRRAFLLWLCGCADRAECALHAYVLMGNHVHLLLTPARAEGGSQLLDALCARYARHLAERHAIPAGIWEDGFHATPVYAARYLFACMRYIESNPVQAGLVRKPEDYRWSSHRANALGEDDALVTPHPLYYALGRTPAERQARYREMSRAGGAMRMENLRTGTGE